MPTRVAVILSHPVAIGGRRVAEVAVRPPTAREFAEWGSLDRVKIDKTKVGVEVTVDIPGALRRWLRRCIVDLSPQEVDALLAELPLVDAIRLQRALAPLFFRATREDVEALTAAIAFDHSVMSLAEADALELPDLSYLCRRLTDHLKRRAREQQRRRR